MRRMRTVTGIVVAAGIRKGILITPGTGIALMNMKSEYIGSAWFRSGGKAINLCNEYHSVRGLIK